MSPVLSLLDLALIAPGQSARESLAASVALAQAAERGGYRRVWYAEHHNMASIASSATSVVIGHVAAQTDTIRLGSGGIMLPNHSPLVIAEQFSTLETLFPGRIDLGLGRAPGTDQTTMLALRRDPSSADSFPQDVLELRAYLEGKSLRGVRVVPHADGVVPLYILGSSLFGAQLAAQLGLPYAFASHFAPDALHRAVEVYRDTFKPSDQLAEPYVIAGVNVFAAEDHDDAVEQQAIAQRSRTRMMLSQGRSSPVDFTDAEIDAFLVSPNGRNLAAMAQYTAAGTPAEVRAYLEDFAASAQADELILAHHTMRPDDRVRSVELTAGAMADALR
ncbi:LLM class flavin-dependent oxidoreductase [Actinomadura sp. 9N407]|uniref:LLM class flavin-dependent oxidoreductase n=1 Tax=Actinomadura sp. 9N407 TaxID=3375154 RepID=UPI0037916A0F